MYTYIKNSEKDSLSDLTHSMSYVFDCVRNTRKKNYRRLMTDPHNLHLFDESPNDITKILDKLMGPMTILTDTNFMS